MLPQNLEPHKMFPIGYQERLHDAALRHDEAMIDAIGAELVRLGVRRPANDTSRFRNADAVQEGGAA
jgi:hypothetical protein